MVDLQKRLLTIDEVAKRFGVTHKRVYKWARCGKLHVAARTRRGRNLYRLEDVERLEALNEVGMD